MEQPRSSYPRPSEVEWKELLRGVATGAIAAVAGMLFFCLKIKAFI
jgi:hypothetical protein